MYYLRFVYINLLLFLLFETLLAQWKYRGTGADSVQGHKAIVYQEDMMIHGTVEPFWRYNLHNNTWASVTISGTAPPLPCFQHSLNYFNNTMIRFGGEVGDNSNVRTNDLWVFSFMTEKWKQYDNLDPEPLARNYHSSIVYESDMIVFGGYNGANMDDLWVLNLSTFKWVDKTPTAKPTARRGHSAVLYDSKMYIFGGFITALSNELWALQLNQSVYEWSQITQNTVKPTGRQLHSAIIFSGKMFVFGGQPTSTDVLWKFELVTKIWTEVSVLEPKPTSRNMHTAVVANNKMIIFGGNDVSGILNQLWEYDLDSCDIPTSGDVTLTSDCILYSEIVVTGALNVTGIPDAQGNLPKIIGGGSNRLFKVESGGALVVKFLNLTGGVINSGADDVQKSGGAILLEGTSSVLIASDSLFYGNRAVKKGGAIYAYIDSRSVISNCKFISNYISGGVSGGAIDFEQAYSNLTNNEFVFNKVQGSHGGSAIAAWSYQNPSEIQILKSNFTYNTFEPSLAIKHGAAIALYYCKTFYGCKVVIKDSHFVGNVVSSETTGAAMYVWASDLMVSNSFIFQPYVFVILQQGTDTEVKKGGWLSVVNSTIDAGTSAWKIVKSETTGSPSYTRLVFVNIRMISSNNGILTDAISPESCTSAPAQCADNGYQNSICTTSQNPDEGVICAQNCSVGYHKAGTFNHTCEACPPGKYNNLWNEHECQPWSDCSSGHRVATNGTRTSNRVCTPCGAGTYSTSANAFSCTAWSDCVAGQKLVANGTSSTDRTCVACPTGQFSTATNQVSCTNWTVCNATTEVESSAGSATADRVCTPAGSPSPSGVSPSPADSPSPAESSPAGSPSPSEANTTTTGAPINLNALNAAGGWKYVTALAAVVTCALIIH
jgi:hypothetical protein